MSNRVCSLIVMIAQLNMHMKNENYRPPKSSVVWESTDDTEPVVWCGGVGERQIFLNIPQHRSSTQ